MNLTLLRRLILYLIDQIQDHEGQVSKIRIVKLLYLIDVEHYRSHGKTLTELDWIFYHYGPWAPAIDEAISSLGYRMGPESIVTSQGYDGFTYRVEDQQDIDDIVKFGTKIQIDRIVKYWALEDTRELLDYVYTETEPMRSATYREPLDFSQVRRDLKRYRSLSCLELPGDELNALRERFLNRTRTKQRELSPAPKYDEAFFKAMAVMDSEDKGSLPEGRVSISLDVLDNLLKHTD